VVKGDRGKAPSGMGGLPGESGTEVVENGVEPPYSIFLTLNEGKNPDEPFRS